jgi:hypothetical protein
MTDSMGNRFRRLIAQANEKILDEMAEEALSKVMGDRYRPTPPPSPPSLDAPVVDCHGVIVPPGWVPRVGSDD